MLTPPLATSGCLPGVTRAILLEEIWLPGLNIREEAILPKQLEESDGVFISSTTRDCLPVFPLIGGHCRSRLKLSIVCFRPSVNSAQLTF